MNRTSLMFACLTSAVLLGACDAPTNTQTTTNTPDNCFGRTSAQIGGPFELTSHTGEIITQEDFKGQRTLVFFGYTYCPDVCPLSLFKAGSAMKQLDTGVEAPQTLFISVDPERDTPETLSQYIASNGFPDDITGATGTVEQLETVSTAFAAPFERIVDDTITDGYDLNHSAILYMMDKDWNLETFFTASSTVEEITSCVTALDAAHS